MKPHQVEQKRTTRQSASNQERMASSQEDNMKWIRDQLEALANIPKQIESIKGEIQREVVAIKESLEFSQSQLASTILKVEDQTKTISKLQNELQKEKEWRLVKDDKVENLQQREVLAEDYTRWYNLIIQGIPENKDENCREKVLADKVENLQQREVLAEDYTRRYNLIIQGIPENKDENCREKVLAFIRNKLKIEDEPKIDTAHRLGKPITGKDRQMIVRFVTQDDRNHVWGKRRELKGIGLYLNEDLFSRETKGKRATLHKVVKEANKQGMRSSLLGDSLIIEGRRYTVDSLHTLPPEINPVAISTRNTGENAIAFFTHLSPLSNFHKGSFQIDGQWFSF